MHKEENIEELKELMKKSETINDAFSIVYQMLENEDSIEELCEVLQQMKLTEEMKEEIEKEEILKK